MPLKAIGMSMVCAAPESMAMFMVPAVAGGCVEVCDPYYTDYKGQESFSWCGIDDCRLTAENERHRSLWETSLYTLTRQEATEESSQNPWEQCWSGALHSRWLLAGVGLGKDSVFFKGPDSASLTMLQWVYRQHELDLIFLFLFSSFLVGKSQSGVGTGRMRKWMWSGHIVWNLQSVNILCHEKIIKLWIYLYAVLLWHGIQMWSTNMICLVWILFKLIKVVLWSSMWSMLMNVSYDY